MNSTILISHLVRFRGPALDRRARGALSASRVTVIKREATGQWGPQLQTYLVSVGARDLEDAIRRVREALTAYGNYQGFAANAA